MENFGSEKYLELRYSEEKETNIEIRLVDKGTVYILESLDESDVDEAVEISRAFSAFYGIPLFIEL